MQPSVVGERCVEETLSPWPEAINLELCPGVKEVPEHTLAMPQCSRHKLY